jgi:hypothetical protein
MSRGNEEAAASWLIVLGAALLFASLFLAWSHQLSPVVRSDFGRAPALQGVPSDPTAWQVYSAADVLLTLLAIGLVAAARTGSRSGRQLGMAAAAIALVFVIHALSVPPTNGIDLFNTINNVPHAPPATPGAGPGETLAVLGLLAALAGLALSLVAQRPGRRGAVA